MAAEIKRPKLEFVEKNHQYYLDGEKLAGISSVSKIGEDEAWGIASTWGWKIGYQGANDVYLELIQGYEEEEHLADKTPLIGLCLSYEELRQELKERKLAPWNVRDKAATRGTWVHDVLESLAQDGTLPEFNDHSEEEKGHARAVLRWYLDHRPTFLATEVQVVSEKHKFAGRYDIRCRLHGEPPVLCLIDLKTTKGIYPSSHFVQLSGYELASVEMGNPRTDAQYVLNTHSDGQYEFVRSTSQPEDFLSYLTAYRTIQRIKKENKRGN